MEKKRKICEGNRGEIRGNRGSAGKNIDEEIVRREEGRVEGCKERENRRRREGRDERGREEKRTDMDGESVTGKKRSKERNMKKGETKGNINLGGSE